LARCAFLPGTGSPGGKPHLLRAQARRGGHSVLTTTGGCGKAAADHFCRSSGFDTALTFQRRQVMSGGGEEPTGFTQIKCYKPTVEGSSKPVAVTNTAGKSSRLVGADLR
jgi:hypothetical protein